MYNKKVTLGLVLSQLLFLTGYTGHCIDTYTPSLVQKPCFGFKLQEYVEMKSKLGSFPVIFYLEHIEVRFSVFHKRPHYSATFLKIAFVMLIEHLAQ